MNPLIVYPNLVNIAHSPNIKKIKIYTFFYSIICSIYYSFLVVAFISHLRCLLCLLINIYGIMDISINLDYRKYGIG